MCKLSLAVSTDFLSTVFFFQLVGVTVLEPGITRSVTSLVANVSASLVCLEGHVTAACRDTSISLIKAVSVSVDKM